MNYYILVRKDIPWFYITIDITSKTTINGHKEFHNSYIINEKTHKFLMNIFYKTDGLADGWLKFL